MVNELDLDNYEVLTYMSSTNILKIEKKNYIYKRKIFSMEKFNFTDILRGHHLPSVENNSPKELLNHL